MDDEIDIMVLAKELLEDYKLYLYDRENSEVMKKFVEDYEPMLRGNLAPFPKEVVRAAEPLTNISYNIEPLPSDEEIKEIIYMLEKFIEKNK